MIQYLHIDQIRQHLQDAEAVAEGWRRILALAEAEQARPIEPEAFRRAAEQFRPCACGHPERPQTLHRYDGRDCVTLPSVPGETPTGRAPYGTPAPGPWTDPTPTGTMPAVGVGDQDVAPFDTLPGLDPGRIAAHERLLAAHEEQQRREDTGERD